MAELKGHIYSVSEAHWFADWMGKIPRREKAARDLVTMHRLKDVLEHGIYGWRRGGDSIFASRDEALTEARRRVGRFYPDDIPRPSWARGPEWSFRWIDNYTKDLEWRGPDDVRIEAFVDQPTARKRENGVARFIASVRVDEEAFGDCGSGMDIYRGNDPERFKRAMLSWVRRVRDGWRPPMAFDEAASAAGHRPDFGVRRGRIEAWCYYDSRLLREAGCSPCGWTTTVPIDGPWPTEIPPCRSRHPEQGEMAHASDAR